MDRSCPRAASQHLMATCTKHTPYINIVGVVVVCAASPSPRHAAGLASVRARPSRITVISSPPSQRRHITTASTSSHRHRLSLSDGSHLAAMKSPSASRVRPSLASARDHVYHGAAAAPKPGLYSQSPEAISSGPSLASADGSLMNPLKRRILDASVDYPRRRATIAVCLVASRPPPPPPC